MQWTDEHHQLKASYLKFIEREIEPYVDRWEAEEQFPAHALFKKLGDAGFLGIHREPAWGGQGLDYSFTVAAAEALGHCSVGGVPMAIGVQTDMCTPALARFGSDELKREFLAPSIAGDRVGCLGVSEPGAGSDVAAIRTTARPDGDDWVISGSKMWITNGMQADWMCLLANTSDGHRTRNKSLIVLPMDARGIERQKIKKTGMWCSDTAQIFLEEVRVPRRHTIGEEGRGFTLQMVQFQEERLWGAANVLGTVDTALEATKAYTRERHAFGQPLLDNQWIHYRLAELSTEVEALRSLVWRATERYVAQEDVTRLASMAKLKAGRLIREVADTCMQFWGGMGYAWDSRMSRLFRDGRLVSIGAGADEIMLGIICKLEGTLPPRKEV